MTAIKLTASSIVSRNGELLTSEIDGETVMMSVENGEYYGMDAIGSRIWGLIEEPRQVSDLVRLLLEEFDTDEETCLADALDFLSQLAEYGVVKSS